MTISLADRLAGGVWGHLVGDALGVPYEFGGPVDPKNVEFGRAGGWQQPAGTWSDDGALMLALLDSLLTRAFDTTDQAKRALSWYRQGRYAPGGNTFDIGGTTRRALEAFESGKPAEEAGPTGERSCGNGSLMRILPLALVRRSRKRNELVQEAHLASRVTHGHHRTQVACALYALIARRLLHGTRRQLAINGALRDLHAACSASGFDAEHVAALAELEAYGERGGSGYVLDSFWSAWDAFAGARSYEDTVRRAVAYGNDTDTTAAIAGGLAGIHWGIGGIPGNWLAGMRDRQIVAPLVARICVSTGEQYTIYVIELDEGARVDRGLRERNPNPRSDKPCLYVGYTSHTPEERFEQHKNGKNDSPLVRDFGLKLRPDLYRNAPIASTRDEAEKTEERWAKHLRRKGFSVWEGGLGPLEIERRQPD